MGNEESTPVDENTPPQTLSARTLEGLAEYIKSGKASQIVVMTGAGISTSAGIPDFRSPEAGLYANLARLNLPFAEAVFDIAFFRENPEPFYTLAHELYPGKFRPTITHSFIRLLHDKGLLLKLFTQNIDCLEREAGVPDDKIVEAHGSFARQSCIECKHPYPEDDIKRHIAAMEIPRCHECKGLVKPEIVFFGEQLPAAFFESRTLPMQSDLCIVMGTSLTVQPFASLPGAVREHTPRVLINKERVGSLGTGTDDVLLLGDCDTGVKRLAEACGWLEELEELWAATAPAEADEAETHRVEAVKSKDERLDDEITKLTKDIDETLNLSKWHQEKIRGETMPKASSSPAKQQESSAMAQGLDSRPHESDESSLKHVFPSLSGDEEPSEPALDASKTKDRSRQ
ncbi:Sir2 histone deacetylase Hst2 [Teratosphaeriaceae sp. CCFEE 6253]|nr:Sir2 histone deacetylase Hst2 [Teratosphaeriaceae sp. CCFEE 6253]